MGTGGVEEPGGKGVRPPRLLAAVTVLSTITSIAYFTAFLLVILLRDAGVC